VTNLIEAIGMFQCLVAWIVQCPVGFSSNLDLEKTKLHCVAGFVVCYFQDRDLHPGPRRMDPDYGTVEKNNTRTEAGVSYELLNHPNHELSFLPSSNRYVPWLVYQMSCWTIQTMRCTSSHPLNTYRGWCTRWTAKPSEPWDVLPPIL
jgi:hypothetical protein